jgi:hypothetical protein
MSDAELTIAEERDLFDSFSYVADGKPRRLCFSISTAKGKRSRWNSIARKGFVVVDAVDFCGLAYFSLRATDKGEAWLRTRLSEVQP